MNYTESELIDALRIVSTTMVSRDSHPSVIPYHIATQLLAFGFIETDLMPGWKWTMEDWAQNRTWQITIPGWKWLRQPPEAG